MNLEEAIKYLYSLGNEMLAMKLGLDSIGALAGALGAPQRKFPAVHIAGTNGKGSTAAMTASILRRAGLHAGLYTSPHLVSITERIRVDEEEITPGDFARLATEVRAASERLVAENRLQAPPTFFEQVTMIGFLYFAESEIDLAVLEVGLGGRLDATNICEPVVTAVTPVDFDHQQILGDTLAEIAGEKAGILKPGVPVVVAPQTYEAMETIRNRAAEIGAPLIAVPQSVDAECAGSEDDLWNAGRFRLRYRSPRDHYDALVNLRGRHQVINALTAIHIAEQLGEEGFPITRDAVLDGLERVEWPGRLEMAAVGEPARPLLLDGAHNAAGGRVLRDFLREHCAPRPITLVFGAMADKAIAGMADVIFPLAERIIVTKVNNPRAASPQAIAEVAATSGREVISIDGVEDALKEALRVTPANGLICACGSLFLVGEIKERLLLTALK
ncbi:MAG: bifunctional folylpolyglutamate synthase/dihydrofolate synthase [Blastocatellia bacterium]